MTHVLHTKEVPSRFLTRTVGDLFPSAPGRAAVKVKVATKDRLEIQPGILVLRLDTEIAPLPERLKIVDDEGKEVKPSKGNRFYISLQTIDPYHVVLEGP